MLVGQCASCGAPASLGCTVCGRTFCKNCLDADERLCADCLQGQRRARGGTVDVRPPPSRRVVRRTPGMSAKD
ncbi:MAG TPA: hypothetical protein VMH49_01475 [Thermoplasmata archaeon]|nr:hypothetical protein [Thermoplasmata archaeon]